MNVLDVVKEVIVEIKDISEDEITLKSSFQEDLETDSLDIVEMLMLLEEKFDIQIPEADAADLKTVADVVSYIENKLN